ncbi:hypothetical protein BH10ACT11_BH10ACT11_05050 [soil metagenome]
MADRKLKLEIAENVIVHWDEDALEAISESDGSLAARPWHLHGEPPAGASAMRVLSARLDNGSLLLIAALRPEDADGHDAEQPSGLMLDGDGLRETYEVLLSTEYDRAGSPRRVSLEIYPEEDSYPVRAAGDTVAVGSEESDGWRRDTAQLKFRLDGREGVA